MIAALICAALLAVSPTPRSSTAARRFMRETGYPHGRPGWIVDHVIPLARGGKDSSDNMIWQRAEDARCKDRFEQWVPVRSLIRHYGKGAMRPGLSIPE